MFDIRRVPLVRVFMYVRICIVCSVCKWQICTFCTEYGYMYCTLKFEVRNVRVHIRQTLCCPVSLFLDRGGEGEGKDFFSFVLASLLFICSPFFFLFFFR